MKYIVDDKELTASQFIEFVNNVWPGEYDREKTRIALTKTLNITAYDNNMLVGCLRILSDGYYFGTITEILVPMLYFGSQPRVEKFYEKNGCLRGLTSYTIETKR